MRAVDGRRTHSVRVPTCLLRLVSCDAQTKMSGFFQTLFYFSYMAIFCLALGVMCGTLGYTGCSIFVRRIYRNIKSD